MDPLTKQYTATASVSATHSSLNDQFTPIRSTFRLPSQHDVEEVKRLETEKELAYKVRDQLLCVNVNEKTCAAEVTNKGCVVNIGYTMFHCPKACGFCTKGSQELCIDFYLQKCPKLAAEGKCTDKAQESWMSENCRQSCNICT